MSAAPFTTLAQPAERAEVIGGSDFLAFTDRADTPEAALAQLAAVRARHPDATHHCWAYRIGGLYRFNDDGEPGGTAGAPILRAIEGQGLDHVMAVVVRHYGGTKLGTGGLVRAYGGVTAECLRVADRLLVRPRVTVTARAPFAHASALYRALEGFEAERGAEAYSESGLTLPVSLFPEDLPAFRAALRDATRGQADVEGPEGTPTDDGSP